METRIWSKSEEKWAYILVLRGPEVSLIKITGNTLTLKGNVRRALEALEQGEEPSALGAKSVRTIDASTITKAELNPENDCLTIEGGPDGSESISYSTPESEAEEILREILAASGRTFQPSHEGIGLIGALGGLIWAGLYQGATILAAGGAVEARGIHRRAFQRLLIRIAAFLGPEGTLAIGMLLFILTVFWALKRVIRRPERDVWLPEPV